MAVTVVPPSYPYGPQDYAGLKLYMPAHGVGAYQNFPGTGAWNPAAVGSQVCKLDTPTFGLQFQQYTDARNAPVFANSATQLSYLQFQPTAFFSSQLSIKNSTKLFREIHKSQIYTIHVRFAYLFNSANQDMLSNTDGTGTHIGFRLRATSAGKLVFSVFDGASAAHTCASITSTVNADPSGGFDGTGWATAQIVCNGPGTNTGQMIITQLGGSPTSKNFSPTASGASSTADAFSDLFLGANGSLANPWVGGIGEVVIQSAVATAGELADFQTRNPAQVLGNFNPANTLVRRTMNIVDGVLPPNGVNCMARGWDFTDVTKLFTDVAIPPASPTTVATSDGDGIGTIRNLVEGLSGGLLPTDSLQANLYWDAASKAKPVFHTGVVNSKAAVKWNGNQTSAAARGDDNMLHSQFNDGEYTAILVFQNLANDVADPGHNGMDMFGGTDADYVQAVGSNIGQSVIQHFNPHPDTSVALQVGAQQFNVAVFRKSPPMLYPSCDLVQGTPTTQTDHDSWIGGRLGIQHNAAAPPSAPDPTIARTFEMKGYMVYAYYYNADLGQTLSDAIARGLMVNVGLAVPPLPTTIPRNSLGISMGINL